MTKMSCAKGWLFKAGLFGFLALVMLAPASYATSLAPGTCAGVGCVPGSYTDFGTAGMFGALIVADTGVESFTGLDFGGNTKFIGNFRSIVIKDTITGGLDFLYQIQRTGGPDSIGRLTTVDFAGVTTDVGICSACSSGGNLLTPLNANPLIAPQFVARGPSADDIKFDFGGTAGTQLGDSNMSSVLVVKTNATIFARGSSSIIDGGIANVSSFQPNVPEPTSLLLLGTGLVGLAGLRIKRNKEASAKA